ADIDAQVRWLCGRLGYPEPLAETWRDLEHPDETEPPWGWPAPKPEDPEPPPAADVTDAASPEPPHESSA
ncbi:MAG: hypothetical protein DI570_24765, partial [Phenylobacterium zucineum]